MVADVKKLIGDQIRKLRRERGLSQEDLGYRSELHSTHIGAIERGEKNWSIDTLIKVAKGLNIEIADLFAPFLSSTDSKLLKKSLIEGINTASPEALQMLLDLSKGFKALESKQTNRKRRMKV
jgi:XRE family transcriptional regulator, regulator of sulfur utilization